jgi:hypothetical protein
MPNYLKIYQSLCHTQANLNRQKFAGVYYEKHHIIPRSLGGSNNSDNHKQFIRDARLNAAPRSIQTRIKMSNSAVKRGSNFKGNHTIVTCTYCMKEGQTNAMLRWHFSKCKEVTYA